MTKNAQRGNVTFWLIALCGFFVIVALERESLQEIGIGFLSAKFANSGKVAVATPPVRQFSLTGTWNYTGRSSMTPLHCTRIVRLTMEGNQVSGVMSPCDVSQSGVEGTFNGNTLTLSRDTGMNATQKVRLIKQSDDRFEGNYWNEGTTRDEGSFEIWR